MVIKVSLLSGAIASDGVLSIQSNGTTEAISISTAQVVTFVNNPVITGGTANGVAYLNGSKVVTTGSALTFNGASNFSYGGSNASTYNTINVNNTASNGYSRILFNIGASGANGVGAIKYAPGIFFAIGTDSDSSSTPITFNLNNSEQMRLTSTGLGIGTSSPGYKLDVQSSSFYVANFKRTSAGASAAIQLTEGSGGTVQLVCNGATSDMSFRPGGTELMLLNSSGNLGLGVTPSAWNSVQKVFENSYAGNAIYSGSGANNFGLTSNAYYSTGWKYGQNGFANRMNLGNSDGSFAFYTAPSGTAGNAITFTQAMTLDASGNLVVGSTSANGKFSVSNAGANGFEVYPDALPDSTSGTRIQSYNRSTSAYIPQGYNASDFRWFTSSTERARIDSSGNLLLGTTTSLSTRFVSSATNNAGAFVNTTATSATAFIWNQATSGNNLFLEFETEGTLTTRGSISYNRAGGLTVYNTTSDYRAKDIVGPIIDSGAVIDATPVYIGKMHGATQERPMFIAHETPAYAHTGEKDAVDKDGNPIYQQMDASALIPVMWAEIQSLRARVAQLEGK